MLGFDSYAIDERWSEASLGSWTGRTARDLKGDGSGDYSRWRAGTLTPPDAESFAELRSRVVAVVESLAHTLGPDGTALVVTHGGPIRAVRDHFVGLAPDALVPVEPASLTILDFTDRWRLRACGIAGAALDPDPSD